MSRTWIGAAVAAAMLAACGTQTAKYGTPTEEETLATAEHKLSSRIKDTFGEKARVAQTVEAGDKWVVSVADRGAPIDGDALPPVAIAVYEPATDALKVVTKEMRYRGATLVRNGTALLGDDDTLTLRTPDGADKLIASHVRGDVVGLADGRIAATLYGADDVKGETQVAIASTDGTVKVIADGEGADNRPAISPDGKTVVFVSGRTGVASFFRTDIEGAEPVQLTNVGIEVGVERDGDPEGFVPPPVSIDRMQWIDEDTLRFDAGDNQFWKLNVRTGAATREEA